MNRRHLPDTRTGQTEKLAIGQVEMYITCNFFDDGQLGEVFLKVAKAGSFTRGILDALSTTISVALQAGTDWDTLASKYDGQTFEPNDDQHSSIISAISSAVTRCRDERLGKVQSDRSADARVDSERDRSVQLGETGPDEDLLP